MRILIASALFCFAGAASAQLLVHHAYTGDQPGDTFGQAIADLGDLDADGYRELGVFYRVLLGQPDRGQVRVLSGRDGSVMYTWQGAAIGDFFGMSMGSAGDVDADGHDDVIVGAPQVDLGLPNPVILGGAGYAQVYSGATGQVLYTFTGGDALDKFGGCVGGCGDVNGDGHDDVIIGGSEINSAVEFSYMRVYSGANGQLLYVLNTSIFTFGVFATVVCGAGDMNGDGFDDFAVAQQTASAVAIAVGTVTVYSGFNGSVIHQWVGGPQIPSFFGTCINRAGDVNGDGVEDLIVGSPLSSVGGNVRVLSGADGATLHDLNGDVNSFNSFGSCVTGLGDVDFDACSDFAVRDNQTVRIYSGLTGVLLDVFDAATLGTSALTRVASAGDMNGDGFRDFIFSDWQTGKVFVASYMGAKRFGGDLGGTQVLDLGWEHVGPTGQGLIAASGAGPFNTAVLTASIARTTTQIFGIDLLVDLSVGTTFFSSFDAQGEQRFVANLDQPFLAGVSVYVQIAEINFQAPQYLFASNGLELHFAHP